MCHSVGSEQLSLGTCVSLCVVMQTRRDTHASLQRYSIYGVDLQVFEGMYLGVHSILYSRNRGNQTGSYMEIKLKLNYIKLKCKLL